MFSISHRKAACALICLLILSVVLLPGVGGKRSRLNFNGSVALADASTPRSYNVFIRGAYSGAFGRLPSCEEEQAEFDALVYATVAGQRRQEAERFVSTLFETQASFDDPSVYNYCQSYEYESLNPANCDPFVNNRSGDFITDLYQAFLLREPEPDGFNGWMAIIPDHGRKDVLNGFRFSVEFGILVNALYEGTRPVCVVDCPECNEEPCPGPNTTRPNPICP